MDPPRSAPNYTLEVFAEPSCVKDVLKAMLHVIFFHRYFIPISPSTRDLLDQTLPAIDDVDLETLIDQRATSLVRAIEMPNNGSSSGSPSPPRYPAGGGGGNGDNGYYSGGNGNGGNGQGRGQVVVQFFEKKRRKTYFFGRSDEDVCWETWTLDVTCASPRNQTDMIKVRRAMEKSIQKTAMKIVTIVNRDKDHIPPITTTETNPFPYSITVNPPRNPESAGPRMGIF